MAGEINFSLIDSNAPYEASQAFWKGQDQAKQSKLADLAYQATVQQQQDESAIRDAYKQSGGDTNKLLQLLNSQGNYKAAQAVGKQLLDAQKTQAGILKDQSAAEASQFDTHKKKIDFMANETASLIANPTYENMAAGVQRAVDAGILPADQAQQQLAQAPRDPETIKANAMKANAQLMTAQQRMEMLTPKPQVMNLGGRQVITNMNPNTDTFGKELGSFNVTPTPDAMMTDARMRSEGALNRGVTLRGQTLADARARDPSIQISHGIQGLTPQQNEALFGDNGAVTTGRLDPNRINSRTARILADAFIQNPGTDFAKISADIALGRNPAFRQRANTAEVLPEIMNNMVESGKKVDFSNYKPIAQMQAWVRGQTNDPALTEYMVQRNDALMTIAGVMRGVGMTDQAHRAETEVAAPTMSPQALDAWLQGQMTSIKPRLKINRKFTRDVPSGTDQPAQTSKPPRTTPSLPAGWSVEVNQ